MDYLLTRLQEGSTVRGLIWLAASFGIFQVSDDQAEAITAVAMALGGVAGIVTPDRLRKQLGKLPPDRDADV